MKFTF